MLEYFQERFKYIMVDEYQDTNTAQFKFVSLLAEKYRNLCVVGDDDQFINKFRGANIKNILGFEHVFADAKVVRLEASSCYSEYFKCCQSGDSEQLSVRQKLSGAEKLEGDSFRQFMNAYQGAEYIVGDISKKVRRKMENTRYGNSLPDQCTIPPF